MTLPLSSLGALALESMFCFSPTQEAKKMDSAQGLAKTEETKGRKEWRVAQALGRHIFMFHNEGLSL